jgi:hypothetical protein
MRHVRCLRFAAKSFSDCWWKHRGEKEDAMIKKVSGGYQVVSSKGKNLGGPYKTLDAAKKRLRQVEFFKNRKH